MPDTPDSKVVLITGCSSGFGKLIATTLARGGYNVFASMRAIDSRNRATAGELESLGRAENLRLSVIELDVTSAPSVERAVARVLQEAGVIDVLINNAGVAAWGVVEAYTPEQAANLFATNFFGPLLLNRAVLPHMRQRRRGLLVHMSSAGGRLVVPTMGLYCATKFALEAMAETLRYELSQLGVDSVIVEPGPYPTDLFGKDAEPADAPRAAEYGAIAGVATGVKKALETYPADSQEVADAVVKLIEMPAGTRPLRTLLGSLVQPFAGLNDTSLQMQTGAMQIFGLTDLMTLKRADAQSA